MTDDNANTGQEIGQPSRRDFVRSSAGVAVTAPAVALLLSASTKPAMAQPYPCCNVPTNHILDDFTFGNSAEDIDAVQSGTNFTSFGKPAIDDHNAV